MTLAELLAKIAAMEGGEDMVKIIQAELNKKNTENQKLRDRAKAAETEAANAKRMRSELLKHLKVSEEDADADDFDLEEALEAFINSSGDGKGKGKDSPEFIELQKQVKLLTKNVEKLTTENKTYLETAQKETKLRHDMMIENALLKSLEENKAVKPGFLAKSLAANIFVNEEGKLVYKDGDNEVEVADGVKNFLTANPEFVISSQKGGTGGVGGPGGQKTEVEAAKTAAEERNKGPQQPAGGINPWASFDGSGAAQ